MNVGVPARVLRGCYPSCLFGTLQLTPSWTTHQCFRLDHAARSHRAVRVRKNSHSSECLPAPEGGSPMPPLRLLCSPASTSSTIPRRSRSAAHQPLWPGASEKGKALARLEWQQSRSASQSCTQLPPHRHHAGRARTGLIRKRKSPTSKPAGDRLREGCPDHGRPLGSVARQPPTWLQG